MTFKQAERADEYGAEQTNYDNGSQHPVGPEISRLSLDNTAEAREVEKDFGDDNAYQGSSHGDAKTSDGFRQLNSSKVGC